MHELELKTQTGIYISNKKEQDLFSKQGKFSYIVKGFRVEDNKPVIIKKIKNADSIGNEQSLKLIREILLNLHTLHEGICQTYDLVKNDNDVYIIREFIDGCDLKHIINNKNLKYFSTPDFTAKIGIGVCNIFSEIHKQGIIHRDIKPANIMIENAPDSDKPDYYNPKIRLIDFELAQIHGMNIFKMDKTPFALIYSSPEQLLRYQHVINPTSDIFSLAITLFEFLSLKPAFKHNNPELLITLQLNHPLIKHVRIPYELFAILHKASQKQAFQLPPNRYSTEEKEFILLKGLENRFQNAAEMKAALEGFLSKYDAIPPAKNIFGKIRAFFQ